MHLISGYKRLNAARKVGIMISGFNGSNAFFPDAATRPRYASVWEKLNELSAFDNFVLAGLAVANPTRRSGYQFEYVHSKA